MGDEDGIKAIWRSTDAVCFDVDSTVCTDETIDELAKFFGEKDQSTSHLTAQAMSGTMSFQEAFKATLDLKSPSRQQIGHFLANHKVQLTDGIKELVDILKGRNIPVYLVTGGIHSICGAVAEKLDIPKEHIFANKLKFFYDGSYAGFDETQPTCSSGGKAQVMQNLKDKHKYKNLVMVGDGVTDMEACPPADAFIGFGGNQVHEIVRQGAKWYVMSFQELIEELHKKVS